MSNPAYYDTDFHSPMADPHVPLQCQRILCFAEGVERGDLTGMEENDRQTDEGGPPCAETNLLPL